MELPLVLYFSDYCYNKNMKFYKNNFLEGKPQNLVNSIYSIIEPEKCMNPDNLLKYLDGYMDSAAIRNF